MAGEWGLWKLNLEMYWKYLIQELFGGRFQPLHPNTSDLKHLTLWEGWESEWVLYSSSLSGTLIAAQDVTEEEEAADEDAADDVIAEDEDDEAEVEDDESTDLVRA